MNKPVKPMLAADANLNKLRFPQSVMKKFDGIRMIVKDGVCFSRSLKPIPNKHVQKLFKHLHGADGELIVGDVDDPKVFSNTTSGVMSFDKIPEVVYYVFDRWDQPDESFEERQKTLGEFTNDGVIIVDSDLVNSLDELQVFIDNAETSLWEGLILRETTKGYKYGRSTANQQNLLRIKFFEDDEFEVIGFEEEYENTNPSKINELGRSSRSHAKAGMKPKGVLGKLIVRNDKWGEFKVGTGFSHKEREWIWNNKDKVLGQIAKVKYQSIGIKDKPRIPVFLGFRSKLDMGG